MNITYKDALRDDTSSVTGCSRFDFPVHKLKNHKAPRISFATMDCASPRTSSENATYGILSPIVPSLKTILKFESLAILLFSVRGGSVSSGNRLGEGGIEVEGFSPRQNVARLVLETDLARPKAKTWISWLLDPTAISRDCLCMANPQALAITLSSKNLSFLANRYT
jgi:hypothetical protein